MTQKPQRVQLSRKRGWRMPPDTVKVDRSTRWGNPFLIGRDGTREECMARFREYAIGDMEFLEAVRKELRGHHLACWCRLDEACHADTLIELANTAS